MLLSQATIFANSICRSRIEYAGAVYDPSVEYLYGIEILVKKV